MYSKEKKTLGHKKSEGVLQIMLKINMPLIPYPVGRDGNQSIISSYICFTYII